MGAARCGEGRRRLQGGLAERLGQRVRHLGRRQQRQFSVADCDDDQNRPAAGFAGARLQSGSQRQQRHRIELHHRGERIDAAQQRRNRRDQHLYPVSHRQCARPAAQVQRRPGCVGPVRRVDAAWRGADRQRLQDRVEERRTRPVRRLGRRQQRQLAVAECNCGRHERAGPIDSRRPSVRTSTAVASKRAPSSTRPD